MSTNVSELGPLTELLLLQLQTAQALQVGSPALGPLTTVNPVHALSEESLRSLALEDRFLDVARKVRGFLQEHQAELGIADFTLDFRFFGVGPSIRFDFTDEG